MLQRTTANWLHRPFPQILWGHFKGISEVCCPKSNTAPCCPPPVSKWLPASCVPNLTIWYPGWWGDSSVWPLLTPSTQYTQPRLINGSSSRAWRLDTGSRSAELQSCWLRIQLCNVCFPASLYCGGEEISGCYVVILTLAWRQSGDNIITL